MFGKLAVVFVALMVIAIFAGVGYSFNTNQLQSVDKNCGPLSSFNLYQNQLTIRDSKSGLETHYQAGDQTFCTYAFNYHSEYWYFGFLALAFAIAALICAIVYMANKDKWKEIGDDVAGITKKDE